MDAAHRPRAKPGVLRLEILVFNPLKRSYDWSGGFMKRSFFLPLMLLVFSLGSAACGERGNGRPMTQDNGNRVSDVGQEPSREIVKEEWSKGKELARKLRTRVGDEWIHSKIVAKLIADKTTPERRISVDVVNHVVTLRGTVENAAQKTEAERIVKQTRGVARVYNRLDVSA